MIVQLGGILPAPPTPDQRESSLDQVLRLLYGDRDDSRLHERAAAFVEVPQFDLRTVRAVLGGVDREMASSSVTVRFGPADVIEFPTDHGFTLFLDKADLSVSGLVLTGEPYEPHLVRIVEQYCRPGATVVDIGANIGFFTMLASRLVGPSGRVVAVEPNSENCRLLLLSAGANQADNVELLPVALDGTRGWSYFATAAGSNGNMIAGKEDDLVDGRGVVVPTFRLDDLIEGPIHLIKMDVEGAEGRAVSGSWRLIEKWRPVITTEFSLEMLHRVSAVGGADYLRSFEERGYTISVLNRETGTPDPPVSSADLLASWPDHLHIEDLLMVPDRLP